MIISSLVVECHLPHCRSLKDKRMIIKSIIDKLKNQFNISIVEVDYNDLLQRSKLGIAMVGRNYKELEIKANKIKDFLYNKDNLLIADFQVDFH